jgi:trimeric autotransporter adhesin
MKTKNLFFMTIMALFGVVSESSGQAAGINGTTVYLQSPPPSPNSINSVHIGQDAGQIADPLLVPIVNRGMNCFIGNRSALLTTSGFRNVFIGYQSALNNTTGSWNTFVGNETGYQNQTGIANTFIGALAGNGVTTGRSNTLIGSSDLIGASGILTGSYNTILGRCIVGEVNNTIAIADGNNHIGYYVNNLWNAGIGTQTPNNKLEIKNNGTPNSSGLRFTNLTSAYLPVKTETKFLTVDNFGDVVLRKVESIGLTTTCSTANFVPVYNATANTMGCSQIYDNTSTTTPSTSSVGINTTGPFGYTSLASFQLGTTIPPTSGNFKLDVNGVTRAVAYFASSDRKFKKDIKSIESPLETIQKLDGKTYLWNKDANKEMGFDNGLHSGFIAQELEKVLPHLVATDEKGYKAVNYMELMPYLVEAIKDQQTQIKAQQVQIEELKNQVSDNFKAQNQDLIQFQNTKIISVSPNPSNDVITVSLNIEKGVQTAKLQVHDINGTVLSTLNINERDTNIAKTLQKDNFGKGIYVVSLVVNGKSIDTKKIAFN